MAVMLLGNADKGMGASKQVILSQYALPQKLSSYVTQLCLQVVMWVCTEPALMPVQCKEGCVERTPSHTSLRLANQTSTPQNTRPCRKHILLPAWQVAGLSSTCQQKTQHTPTNIHLLTHIHNTLWAQR